MPTQQTKSECTCDINGAESDIGHFSGCPVLKETKSEGWENDILYCLGALKGGLEAHTKDEEKRIFQVHERIKEIIQNLLLSTREETVRAVLPEEKINMGEFGVTFNQGRFMKKKLQSKYDLVHIYWHDAAMHGTAQVPIDEVKEYGLMRGHIAGWLVDETKTHVTVAMDFFPKQEGNSRDAFRTLQSYPKSGIDKMQRIKTLEIWE